MRRHEFSNEQTLCDFAADFARKLRPGDVVALSGPLGSGKTTFVRAVVRALHRTDETTSPTFAFWHRYEGEPPIDHLDLFRIGSPNECAELGLEAAFEAADSIALVEWWRNAPSLLPSHRYEIAIEGAGDGPRVVTVTEPA